MKVDQQGFSTLFAFFIEDDAFEMAGPADSSYRHRSDEEVVLPGRKRIAGVKRNSGSRDGRHPEKLGQDHVRPRLALVERRAVVVVAVCHKGPSVILSRQDD